jgi:hypothetical protein
MCEHINLKFMDDDQQKIGCGKGDTFRCMQTRFSFAPTVGVEMAERSPTTGSFPAAHNASNVRNSN